MNGLHAMLSNHSISSYCTHIHAFCCLPDVICRSICCRILSRANSKTQLLKGEGGSATDLNIQTSPNAHLSRKTLGEASGAEGPGLDHIPSIDTVEVSRLDLGESALNKSTKLPPLERGGGKVQSPGMWLQHPAGPDRQQLMPLGQQTQSPGFQNKGSEKEEASLELEECLQLEPGLSVSASASASLARPRGTSMISVMTDQSDNYRDPSQSQKQPQSEEEALKQREGNSDTRDNQAVASYIYNDDDDNDNDKVDSLMNSMMGSVTGGVGASGEGVKKNEKILRTGMYSSQDLFSLDLGGMLTSSSGDAKAHKVNDNEALLKTYGVEYSDKQSEKIRKKDSEGRKRRRALRLRARSGDLDVQEEEEDEATLQRQGRTEGEIGGDESLLVAGEGEVGSPLRGTTRKTALYNPSAGDSPPGSSAAYRRVMQTHYNSNNGSGGEDDEEEDASDGGPNRFPTLDWSYY